MQPRQIDDGEGYGVYNWHRTYIPELGIYTSLDPLLQDHGALYGYAGANPMWFVDPEGLCYWDVNISLGKLIGVTGGIQIDPETWDIFPYLGGYVGTPGWSITLSPNDPAPAGVGRANFLPDT